MLQPVNVLHNPKECMKGEKQFDKNKYPTSQNQRFSKGGYANSHRPVPGTALSASDTVKIPGKGRSTKCRYCAKGHWSDKCPQFRTIGERKRCLKGSCYKCLKEGHRSKDCQSRKRCVFCNAENVHHRSLCPRRFQKSVTIESVHVSGEGIEDTECDSVRSETESDEKVLLSLGEKVIMQTARVELCNESKLIKQDSRVLLDSCSQRTYITEELDKKNKVA